MGMDVVGVLLRWGEASLGLLVCCLSMAFRLSDADSPFGIQRKNGVRSALSTIYQSFWVVSQRAPSAFTASFSVKGVIKLILIGRIIRCSLRLFGYPERVSNAAPLKLSS